MNIGKPIHNSFHQIVHNAIWYQHVSRAHDCISVSLDKKMRGIMVSSVYDSHSSIFDRLLWK